MSTAKQILGQVLELAEPDRSELAIALLDMLDGTDPDGDMTREEFRGEMVRRAEAALANPNLGGDWESLRRELLRDPRT